MVTIAEKGINFRERLEEMLIATDTLKSLIQSDGEHGLSAWVQRPTELIRENVEPVRQAQERHGHLIHRAYVCEAISQIYFINQQDSKETLIFPGLVPASEDTLEAVQALNEAKIAFKESVMEIKKNVKERGALDRLYQEFDSEYDRQLRKRNDAVHAALRRNGSARLCIKQAYRTIPICGYYKSSDEVKIFIQARPTKVGWTWGHLKSITKTNIQKLRESLASDVEKHYDNHALELLRRLDQKKLSPDTKLAKVQKNSPKLIANVVIPNPESKNGGSEKFIRKQFPAVLPIFFPWEQNESLPKFSTLPSNNEPDPGRLTRSDKNISDTPILDGLPYFQYLT